MKCAPIVLADHCPGTTAEENQGGVTTCCKLYINYQLDALIIIYS